MTDGDKPDLREAYKLTNFERTVITMAAALIRDYEAPDLIEARESGRVREIVTRDAIDMANDLWDALEER